MNPTGGRPFEIPTPTFDVDRRRLTEVALLFTKLGFTAFGGPTAHLALMEDEVVRKRGWLDRQHFIDLVAAVNFVPGPNSTEVAIGLGLIRAGYAGMLVSGMCFIVPAMLIILPIAWAYQAYQTLPQVRGMMEGVNAAVVAVVAVACWRFGRGAVKDVFTAEMLLGSIVLDLLLRRNTIADSELIVLGLAAVAGAVWHARPKMTVRLQLLLPGLAISSAGSGVTELSRLALYFLKIGATLFGSGYVLISYLQGGLVGGHHWLTDRQLLDAVSVGQVTPGPLLTTATFIGYVRGYAIFGTVPGGVAGGVVATVAIFLPAFVFVAVLGTILPRVRGNRFVRGALNGMNAAVVALILIVAFQLARTALVPANFVNVTVAVVSLVALGVWNVNATWLIAAGGFAGWAGQQLLGV